MSEQGRLSAILLGTNEQLLGSLIHMLEKGKIHAQERGIEETNFLQMRLFPDMFPMLRQAQIATELAARGAARLAAVDMPSFVDDETDFSALISRTKEASNFVAMQNAAVIDLDPEKKVSLDTPSGQMQFNKRTYLLNFLMPNLYFHASMVYALLRHGGVELGKMDFLAAGKMPT